MDLPLLIFSAVGNLSLGLLVFFKNPRSATNKVFAALTVSLTFMLVANYFSIVSQNLESVLTAIRFAMFFASIVSYLYLLLVLTFPKNTLQIGRRNLVVISFLTILTMITALSPFLFTGIRATGSNVQPTPGPGIILFALVAVGSIIFSVFKLFQKARRSTGNLKLQFNFILLGTSVMFGLIILTVFIPVNLLNFSAFAPFLSVYTLAFVGATTYAIIRHRLMDIRLILARTVAYALLATFLFAVYVFATLIATTLFFKTAIKTEQILLYGVLTLIAGYSFQPLRAVFENLTDKVFYKGLYDSQNLLSRLSNIMATTLGIRPLIAGTLNRLVVEMRITRGAIVVFDKNKILMDQAYNYDEEPKFKFSDLTELHDGKIVILDELEEGHLKDLMRKLNISIAVPLEASKEKLGYLLLGEKASGEIYTNQDIDVLEVFSPELSIAIENSKSYEEIKRFNITLEEKIKKATVDLTSANQRLKDLDKAKDEFVSVVSHELRTPMTAVKSYVWLVLNGRAGPLNPKTQEYLSKVYQSSERLIAMINDVLDVSHIETGRLNIDLQPVSPLKATQEVVDTLVAKANEQKIQLIIKKDDTIPLISADIQKLSEVFTNLIGNALKFTKEGGTINISFQKNGDMIETAVTDTGVGMSKEDLTKLFSKFGRLESSYATMAATGGSGLGLYITKSYVELMHGKIWVNSTLGKGTTFTFALPISKDQKPVESNLTSLVPEGIIKNKS